jgi:DNA-binding transcriptional MerR regulator
MQLIALNEEDFRSLQQQIAELHELMHSKKQTKIAYDNQDVIQMLNVSQRTLATWRENGTLRFSKVGAEIYYQEEHIQEMLDKGMSSNLNKL